MLNTRFTLPLLPLLLAVGGGTANASVLTFQGVNFTATTAGNILTLEIDAAHPAGDWAGATTIGALELQGIGTFSGVTLVQAPGAALGWHLTGQGLSANGCAGGSQAGKFACFSGAHVALQDDMIFKFAFTGAGVDLDLPHVKVNLFTATGTKKLGSLMSADIQADPPTPVSEPRTAALLLGGLALIGALKRQRTGKHDEPQA